MISRFRRHSSLLWLLCIVLLAARVSGAHWHLCNDGNEPPRAVHAWDSAIDDKTEPGHNDTNLNLVDDGLAKIFDKAVDMPALLAAVALFCVLVLPRRTAVLIPYLSTFFPPPIPRFSAPPRAPPQ